MIDLGQHCIDNSLKHTLTLCFPVFDKVVPSHMRHLVAPSAFVPCEACQ